MSLSKFGKSLAVGGAILIFVSVDTCGSQSFTPKETKPSIEDYTVIPYTHKGVEYLIIESKNGDVEVVNTTDQKKITKFLK